MTRELIAVSPVIRMGGTSNDTGRTGGRILADNTAPSLGMRPPASA